MIRVAMICLGTMGLLACGSGQEKEEKDSEPEGEFGVMSGSEVCDCRDLTQQGQDYYKDTLRYTGICLEYYPDGKTKLTEQQFLNGKPHGNFVVYDKNGEVLDVQKYKGGKPVLGLSKKTRTCECSELEVVDGPAGKPIAKLNGYAFTGKCHSLYPDSEQEYQVTHYKNGLQHGQDVIYDKSGEPLEVNQYEMGELVKNK